MLKILRFAGWTLLWACVAGYIVYAAHSAHRARKSKDITRIEISIEENTRRERMVTTQQVAEWISKAGIRTAGVNIDSVDLRAIERTVSANAFVDRVVASATYDGTLSISLTSHHPVVRLLTQGYDCYVTDRGYTFARPELSSLYLPVVTGSYRPPFGRGYEGTVREEIDCRLMILELRKDSLERAKYPLMKQQRDMRDSLRKARRIRAKRGWFVEKEVYEIRKELARKEREKLTRRYTYRRRLALEAIDRLAAKQDAATAEQKKLEKNYEDFMKLLTFVELVETDDFLGGEIVQIVARTTDSGALEVDLIPRSGDFVVRYGRLEYTQEKNERLERFCRKALSVVGWDTYREIDLRYGNQVVCRK